MFYLGNSNYQCINVKNCKVSLQFIAYPKEEKELDCDSEHIHPKFTNKCSLTSHRKEIRPEF